MPAFVQVGLDQIKEGDKLKGVAGSMVINNPVTPSLGQQPNPQTKAHMPNVNMEDQVLLHYFLNSKQISTLLISTQKCSLLSLL